MTLITPGIVSSDIGPAEHVVQFYEDEFVLLDSIEAFIAAGLAAGESAIVIATEEHRQLLELRLKARGIDVSAEIAREQYLALDAAATLSSFMVKGWPDQERFTGVIRAIVERAASQHRRVRAYGEMVALLWAMGHTAATIRLERLWSDLVRTHSFALFCAYPKLGFQSKDSGAPLIDICVSHSRVIATARRPV